MNKSGVRISKTVIKAQVLTVVTLVCVALAIILVLLNSPDSALYKVYDFMRFNHDNPQVFYSDYYDKLSGEINRQDWMIISPICFAFAGMAFGWTLWKRKTIASVLQPAAFTAVFWSLVSICLGAMGSNIEASNSSSYGFQLPTPKITPHVLVMGTIQTVYWTAAFLLGVTAAYYAVNRLKSAGPAKQPSSPRRTATIAK